MVLQAVNSYALCWLLTQNENGSTLPFVTNTDKQGVYCRCLTGPVEGQINRLKFIKRSMYRRGSFKLLRQRVFIAA